MQIIRELVVDTIKSIVPAALIERAQKQDEEKRQARRDAAFAKFKAARERLKKLIQAQGDVVEKDRADETKRLAALQAAQIKTASDEFERRRLMGELSAAEREFATTMRELAPKALLEDLAARVEPLLAKAVPDSANHVVFDSMGLRQDITVWGDADARIRGLRALKRDIQQTWFLEPLTPEQFEHKFSDAVEALPAINPPLSAAEYIKRHNSALSVA